MKIKGQIYTLEVGIAILMILSMVIFLFLNQPTLPEYRRINYKMKVYNGLEALERNGELRRYVNDNNITAINVSLNSFLPGFISRTVVIFNETTNLTAKPSLVNLNDSISVSYLLAGDFDDYKPREVRVYMWGY